MRRLVVCAALAAVACVEVEDSAEVGSSSADVSVTWTNLVGVTATGNDLIKEGGVSAWDAGAVSVETLAGDGYVEFTTGEATTVKAAGLSNGDGGQGYADIDFAIRLRSNGSVGVYENGVLRGSFGTYAPGYVFRVEVEGGAVSYQRNGVTFYTSSVAPTFPLLVDTSLYTPGATIQDVELVATAVTWQNLVGVSVGGDDVTKTSVQPGWTAGASTVQSLTGDGYAEFTSGETGTARAAGLTASDTTPHYAGIQFAIRLSATGVVTVYESGVHRGNFGPYVAGDRFRVEVTGGVVSYSKNGGRPFYTSAVAPTFPLFFDTSFLTTGATIQDVVLVEAAHACLAYDGGGPVCEGSFTIENSLELAAIAHCANITGNLTINAPGLTSAALPSLERVGGDIAVVNSPDLGVLRLPALREVRDLRITIVPTPSTLDLSRLRAANQVSVQVSSGEVSVPCLGSATSFRASAPDGAWARAFVPRLRSVTGVLFGRMTAPLLETAGSIDANLNAPVLTSVAGAVAGRVTAPALVTTGGSVTARPIDAPSLTEIGGTLFHHAGQNLPALERAGGIWIKSTPEVYLPELVEITGTLYGGRLRSVGTCRRDGAAATAIDLPALERVGGISLCSDVLAEVSLPALQTITGSLLIQSAAITSPIAFPSLTAVANGFQLGGVTMNVSADFPVLASIAAQLTVGAPVTAPVLSSVGGDATVRAALTAPVLEQVGGDLTVHASLSLPALGSIADTLVIGRTPSAITISLPDLATAGAIIASSNNLADLELPALTTLDGSSSTDYAIDISNTSLSSFSMPLLSSAAGYLYIQDNGSLASFDLTGLIELTGSPSFLTIANNDVLPNCYATNILDQLIANGWTGTATISGNDGTGTCP